MPAPPSSSSSILDWMHQETIKCCCGEHSKVGIVSRCCPQHGTVNYSIWKNNSTVQLNAEPLVDIYEFKCKLGHEFIDIVPEGSISYFTHARSKDDKPQGGVCIQCNSSIHIVSVKRGVVQKVGI
jgi:hypothetical protein